MCDCNQCPLSSKNPKRNHIYTSTELWKIQLVSKSCKLSTRSLCVFSLPVEGIKLHYNRKDTDLASWLVWCLYWLHKEVACNIKDIVLPYTFQHPPSMQHRDTYSTWMSNLGREKECREESVPEDSCWAFQALYNKLFYFQVKFNSILRGHMRKLGPGDGLLHLSHSCETNSV